MSYLVMTVGDIQYPYLDKPVRYNEEFLKSLAGDYGCDVCDEHDGAKLTTANKVFYKDNKLYADFDEDIGQEGKGFSTLIDVYEYLEYPDYYEPIPNKSKLLSIDRVSKPRQNNILVANSEDFKIKQSAEVSEMSNNEKYEQLIEENGSLKAKYNAQTETTKTLKEQISDLNKSNSEKDKRIKELEEQLEVNESDLQKELKETKSVLQEYKDKELEAKKQVAREVAECYVDKDSEKYEEQINHLVDIYSNLPVEELNTMKKVASKPVEVEEDNSVPPKGKPSGVPAPEMPEAPSIDNFDENSSYEDYLALKNSL